MVDKDRYAELGASVCLLVGAESVLVDCFPEAFLCLSLVVKGQLFP